MAFYLYKLSNILGYYSLHYGSRKESADFILSDKRDGKKIPIEVSYGANKDINQTKKTMKKTSAKYGLIISKKDLKIEDNIVFVPHKLFFLT